MKSQQYLNKTFSAIKPAASKIVKRCITLAKKSNSTLDGIVENQILSKDGNKFPQVVSNSIRNGTKIGMLAGTAIFTTLGYKMFNDPEFLESFLCLEKNSTITYNLVKYAGAALYGTLGVVAGFFAGYMAGCGVGSELYREQLRREYEDLNQEQY